HSCSFPTIRQEWRKMSSVSQSRFLDAVNCLMNTESILDLNHKVSRSVFDDFAFAHFSLVNKVHGTAQFLPWHRTLILLFEFALQDFCSYSGTLPYWDWTLDAQNPSMSPIFSDSAFGGNGQSPSNCIQTGCFSNATVIINHESPQCITRTFQQLNNGMLGSAYTSSIVENLVGTSTWGPFSQTIYSGPHAAVHNALGGDFSFPPAAGNDPLFYVHHSMIDKIWSDWQHMNPSQAATYYGNRDPSMPNAVDAELTDYLAGNSPLIGNWTLFPPIRVQDALWSDGGGWFCYIYA
ncbi:hypothetical protein BDR26DRAFT_807595, partial [Obelidium mucronatum]